MRSTTSQVGGMKTASLPAAAGKRGFEGEGMRRHPSFIIITLKLFGYAWVLLGGNAHAQVRESPCSRIPTHPACSRKTFGRRRMHSSHSFLLRASGGAPSAPALTSLLPDAPQRELPRGRQVERPAPVHASAPLLLGEPVQDGDQDAYSTSRKITCTTPPHLKSTVVAKDPDASAITESPARISVLHKLHHGS